MKRKVGIVSALLALSLVFSGCSQNTKSSANVQTVKLQDDFYEHVNASLIQEKKEASGGESWDQFTALSETLNSQLQKMADTLLEQKDSAAEDSTKRVVGDLYETALDSKQREEVGLGLLKPYLDRVNEAQSIPAYLEAMAKIRHELGKSSLLVLDYSPNPKDSSQYALFIDEPAQLTKKAYMESGDMDDAIKEYIYGLLSATGLASDDASSWSEQLLDFYQKIAKIALSQKDKNNVANSLNYFTIEELQAKLPSMNVTDFLNQSGMNIAENHLVLNPKILTFVNESLIEENLELLKKYTVVSLLHDYAPYLNSAYAKAAMKFNQSELEEKEAAWDAVKRFAEMEVGEVYAKEYFSKAKKVAVEKLVKDILSAYRKKLAQLDWLSEASKQEAIKKVDAMGVKVGYPENVQSDLKGAVIARSQGGNFIDNVIMSDKQRTSRELKNAALTVDRNSWSMSPISVNAYYDSALNEIVFPAAMLQAPFYDATASYAKNLGGIGSIIAHEITHAFDDMGALYDEKGNYRNWWSDQDRQVFKEKSQSFIKYFGNYEGLPGVKVDGELTLGENIADLGGISVISSMLENDVEALKEMYLSYANIWASVTNEEELRDQLQNDNHSPAKVRVNGILSATDGFYKAFNIQSGDGMYVDSKHRVKMY